MDLPNRSAAILYWLEIRRAAQLIVAASAAFGPLLLPAVMRRHIDVVDVAKRLRRLFEQMGMSYVKLGQFLATRFDLLPREICDELGRLFQRVEPMPMPVALAQIAAGLGRPVAESFAHIEAKPLGSASVAQVHRALRHDGRWVAVKVQRPGVRLTFAADMRSLRRLAGLAAFMHLEVGFDISAAIDEFSDFTRRELDFRTEASTAERVRAQHDRTIFIPAVHHDLTTDTVLTLDLVRGVSLSEIYARLDAGEPPPAGLPQLAETLSQSIFRQVFLEAFFHGDPHPGNVMRMDDGGVALVDFGIFGQFDPRQLSDMTNYIEQLAVGDVRRAYDHYSRMVTPTRWSDMDRFRREAIEVLERWRLARADPVTPRSETQIATVADRLLQVLRRNHAALRLDTLLFWRAIILLDANFTRPEMDFDLNRSLQTFFTLHAPSPAQRVFAALTRPALIAEVQEFRASAPGRAGQLLEQVRAPRVRRSAVGGAEANVKEIVIGLAIALTCIVAGALNFR